jgi:hypothetical protein
MILVPFIVAFHAVPQYQKYPRRLLHRPGSNRENIAASVHLGMVNDEHCFADHSFQMALLHGDRVKLSIAVL